MESDLILHQRLAAQSLISATSSAYELLLAMGAMQAQDYYGALWAIGVRTGLTEAEVIDAIERRQIIRTWPQRGTLHFVPAEEATWMTALSADRLLKAARGRHENLGLDEATLQHSKLVFAEVLAGGMILTRPDMMAALESAGIGTQAGRGYHILWYAAQTGLIYIGPMRGKQQTFGLIVDLPVVQHQLTRQQAIITLATRYFSSHNPAGLKDFIWWSGLTSADAKIGLEAYASQNPTKTTPNGDIPEVLLLPPFDEYIVGYKDRQPQLRLQDANRIIPGGNGVFKPTLVIDGRVAGLWKRTIKRNTAMSRLIIKIDAFMPVTAAEKRAIREEAEVYGRFLGITDIDLQY